MLAVDEVSKSYGPTKALDKVSLSLRAGEFVALLGPNGAGKTTLFQLLTALFVADGGRILIENFDIRHQAVTALAGIGVVFQQVTLDLDMTVRANLLFHARLHGMGRVRTAARIDQELTRLSLQNHADRMCRQLSGGNRRKVELARALLHEPRILLMDEATVGLDPSSRRVLVDEVLQLCAQRRIAVLWATHLVDEAERASRVLVLHHGRLISDGTPAELVAGTGRESLADAFLHLTEERAEAN
ncbi:MAG: ATP-binding cassette domain-containing protein [Gammaproteobacteria bacterium]|nr:ATP-binding cassette domain-containing protein [Gammaproteobacteria bacterium]